MHLFSQKIEEKGLPVFWQAFLAFLAIGSLIPLFLNNKDWGYSFLLAISPLFTVGIFFALLSHKRLIIPLVILSLGIALSGIGDSLQQLIYFGVPITPLIALLVKESGILLILIFAFIHVFMFEKKFSMKGFCIDYLLLSISALFLFLMVSPDLFHTLLYELSFHQKILIFNLILGLNILCMSFIHYLSSKSLTLTDGFRLFITTLLVIHFILEVFFSFDKNNPLSFQIVSTCLFYFTGALAIAFIFLEDLSLDFSEVAPNRISILFMWVSSIFAILAIPIGMVIRSTMQAPPIDLLIIGSTSILTSTVVIWRLVVLIKNSNQQKDRLNSLTKKSALTGLSNYQGYLENLSFSKINNALIVHINIEDFKSINDLYGRNMGDKVLKRLAIKLKKLPNSLLTAHIHSDQFLVAFQCKKSNINSFIDSIQDELGSWEILDNKTIAVPLTLGASFKDNINAETQAKEAESAMKKARKDHASFVLYRDEDNQNKIPRNELRQILQQSVDNDYLPVHFQPIYNLSDGSLKAVELLIRVDSEKYGLLLPGQFLEQAKSYALLTSLTQVCIRMLAKHREELKGITVNINLPPYMLKSPNLLHNFIQSFKDQNLTPSQYCIEITEDEDISARELTPSINVLKEHGFSIAMDDFGTGYSSLDRLSTLEVDTVKIDRSILLTSESGNTTILEWAISLAKRIGVSVVVEGVETLDQLSLVKRLGADSVQGFLYARPISVLQLSNISMNANDIEIVH